MKSDSLVSETVEERLAPGLVDQRVQLVLLDGVLDLAVDDLAVDLSLEEERAVFEAEGGPVGDGRAVLLIANLQEELLVVEGIARCFREFSEGNEVVGVDAVEGLQLGGEGLEVHHEGADLDLAAELRLRLVHGDEGDLSIFVSPEAAPGAFHVSSGESKKNEACSLTQS